MTGTAGDSCPRYKEITLRLSLAPVIYLAADLPASSCFYKTVLAHEHDHAATDKMVLERHARRIENALKLAFDNATPYGEIGPEVVAVAAPFLAALDLDRARSHRLLDSPENYKSLTAPCVPIVIRGSK